MSTKRRSQKAGWVSTKQLERGPHGRCLCRWCGTEVPVGRRTFCSDNCVHQHKITTNPGYCRQQVFARDRGVCAVCGLDTVAEEQRLARKILAAVKTDPVQRQEEPRKEFFVVLGAQYGGRRTAGYWDADHEVPVVEGGGECALDNYRTLCIPCHRKATAELRKRLAQTKKREKSCPR